MIIDNFTEFTVNKKVGMLGEGVWLTRSFVPYSKGDYYRVTVHDTENYRAIGIIPKSIFDQSILEGDIIVGKKAKIKIKKDKGVDKLPKV
ncbi:MAG: hypothetical protein ACRCX7_10130 [Cetobacterium sp.]|uniref:hypothetical protein n=1 Tax=Cetobacterium sp. TaxID=2071632 RepID=UPI003F3A458D